MSSSRQDLALRRELLLARSTQLRQQIVVRSAVLAPLLTFGDRLRAAGYWLRRHPEAVIVFALGVTTVRPRVAWRWGVRAWTAGRFYLRLREQLAELSRVERREPC